MNTTEVFDRLCGTGTYFGNKWAVPLLLSGLIGEFTHDRATMIALAGWTGMSLKTGLTDTGTATYIVFC